MISRAVSLTVFLGCTRVVALSPTPDVWRAVPPLAERIGLVRSIRHAILVWDSARGGVGRVKLALEKLSGKDERAIIRSCS